MRMLDNILRNWRVRKAVAHVRSGGRLLDVGCFDGHLLRTVRDRVGWAIGIDPLTPPGRRDGVEFVRDSFPANVDLEEASFDCITLLAVLEHMSDPQCVAAECFRLLRPGGRVVITVPSPQVDHVLAVLRALRLVDGMSLEQHHGFEVSETATVFEKAGFELTRRERFQLGLNNLFVFSKPLQTDVVRTRPGRSADIHSSRELVPVMG